MNIQTKIDSPITTSDQPIVEVLAEFVCDLKHDDIPKTVRTRALHHMLDAAGIALASTRYEFAHKTLAGLQAVGGQGSVPVLGMPATPPQCDAAAK